MLAWKHRHFSSGCHWEKVNKKSNSISFMVCKHVSCSILSNCTIALSICPIFPGREGLQQPGQTCYILVNCVGYYLEVVIMVAEETNLKSKLSYLIYLDKQVVFFIFSLFQDHQVLAPDTLTVSWPRWAMPSPISSDPIYPSRLLQWSIVQVSELR